MTKEEKKYREHLKLESNQKAFVPDDFSFGKKEELKLLNKDPFSHFLKYILPFMTEDEKAQS